MIEPKKLSRAKEITLGETAHCARCGKEFIKKREIHKYCHRKCASLDYFYRKNSKISPKAKQVAPQKQERIDQAMEIIVQNVIILAYILSLMGFSLFWTLEYFLYRAWTGYVDFYIKKAKQLTHSFFEFINFD